MPQPRNPSQRPCARGPSDHAIVQPIVPPCDRTSARASDRASQPAERASDRMSARASDLHALRSLSTHSGIRPSSALRSPGTRPCIRAAARPAIRACVHPSVRASVRASKPKSRLVFFLPPWRFN
ncbi:unnamed protein product [Rhodiola kirilowii]